VYDNPYIDKLDPRQLKFCLYYLNNNFSSAHKAMLDAGYDEAYARTKCRNILKCKKIVSFIRFEMKRRAEEAAMKAIDGEAYALKKAMTEPDPELAQKYFQEYRQFQKQNAEIKAKFSELEKSKTESASNVTINISEARKE
jgi:phage terminase small subunit